MRLAKILLVVILSGAFILAPFSSYGKEVSPPFTLLATAVERDAEASIAVIRDHRAQKQRAYKIGEKIFGYDILKILRGRVILFKDDSVYFLDFPWGSEAEEPITLLAKNVRVVDRSALREKIPNLAVALEQALPIPHIEDGKITGLKVVNIKDKSLAKSAGIKDGDVLMAVDGKKIDSIKNLLEIYAQVKNKEKIDLSVKSGREIKNLTYYIKN